MRGKSDIVWRDCGCTGKTVSNMEVPGRRRRGRPQRTLMDIVKEDVQMISVTWRPYNL